MVEDHTSSLLDTVTKIIRQELGWSERQFKRITMSHDASGNPAELYGADGKIYYRKAGGAGAELGTGGGAGLWTSDANNAWLTAPRNIDAQNLNVFDVKELIIDDGGSGMSYLRFKHGGVDRVYFHYDESNTELQVLVHDGAYRQLRLSALQLALDCNLVMSNSKITGLANGTASNHAATVGQIGGPWELTSKNKWQASHAYSLGNFIEPTTSNGWCYECTVAGNSGGSEPPSWNTTFGGSTLDHQVAWTTRYIGAILETAGPVYMQGRDLWGVHEFIGYPSADIKFWGSNISGIGYNEFARWDHSAQLLEVYQPMDMNTNAMTGVGGITMTDHTSFIDLNDGDITKCERIVGRNDGVFSIDSKYGTTNYYLLHSLPGGLLQFYSTGDDISFHPLSLWTRFWSGQYPIVNNTYQLGTSSYKWSHIYGVVMHEGDHCYSEKICAKCGEAFVIGDAIVHVMIEQDAIDNDTCTIPIHLSCAQEPPRYVEIERNVEDVVESYMEEDGTIRKSYTPRTHEETYKKLVLKTGVEKDSDGNFTLAGTKLDRNDIFETVDATRNISTTTKKTYLI